jgi:hypothetical protein
MTHRYLDVSWDVAKQQVREEDRVRFEGFELRRRMKALLSRVRSSRFSFRYAWTSRARHQSTMALTSWRMWYSNRSTLATSD